MTPASNRSKIRSGNKGTAGVAKAAPATEATTPADAATEDEGMSTGAKVAVAAAAATGAAVAAGVAAATRSGKDDGAEAPGAKPDNLLDAARDGKADDLKKISGVGPKLEGLLHQQGVFHFDQIAAWGSEEIAYMNDRLSFKGRIEREGWIDQAKKFAAEQE